jgi:hypothetical protein
MQFVFTPAIVAALILAVSPLASVASNADRFAPVFVTLSAVGGSGQSGRAVLRQIGPEVVVSGSLANGSHYTLEPAYIHKGSCGSNAPTFHELGSVTGGTIGTRVIPGITIAQLHAMHASIRVHKSAAAMGVLVACGNI